MISIMTLSLLLLFLRHMAVSTADVSLSDIEWVVSDRKGESYPQACQRRSLDTLPINNNSYFTWNESTFRRVVDEVLGMQSWKYNYGIEGCCVTGLWCFTNNTCFTQGYGRDFSNYGWLLSDGTADARPVYSCIANRGNADKFNSWKSLQTVESSTGLVVCDISLNGMELTLNSSTDSDAVLLSPSSTAYIGGNACGNIEVCRSIACKGDEDCPVSNMCFENYCAPICSVNIEKGDMSCACDYTCTAPSSTSTFGVCLPRSTGVGTNVMTCNSSKLVDTSWIMVDGRVSTTLSIVTDQLQVHDITVDNKAHAYCNSDVDCQDGDVCTEDKCDMDRRYCSYSFLPNCDSTDPAIRERSTTFAYHSFYSAVEAIASNQSVAVSFLMRNGQLSSTSNVDGKPEQAIHLPFSFVFFNNIVDMAYISPKGMIILPPHDCDRMWKYDLGSGSNIIAPYCADWNPTSSTNSGIWHYFQKRGDPVDEWLFAVDADAFHVLFFELSILTTQRPLVTFISSMYSDGSIRFSYVTTAVSDDLPYLFIGLLGAYSSHAKNSYHRYKAETIDQSWVESGNSSEVVFCPMTVSTCPMEVCLSPGDQLVLRWDGSLSCEAFGKDFLFRVVCSWGGGIGSTAATHSSVYGNISCPVPQLPGIKQPGTVVQVDVLLLLRSDDDDDDDAMMTRSRLDKSFYVNHLSGGDHSNLSRSTVVIRYFPSNDTAERDHRVPLCGCNAFERGSILSCDDLGICGGLDGDKAFLDCAGTLFGSAVKSTCKQKCTGGFSMVSEDFSCFKAVSSRSSSILDLVKQTIVLLVLICSLCCITYGVSNIARHMTTAFGQDSDHQQNNEQADQFILNMTLQEEHTGLPSLRGMSAFERNALGSVVFSKQLLQEWAEEGQRSSSNDSTATPSQSESAEEKKIMTYNSCDCSICLCSIEEGQLCRRLPLPCGHLFHLGCIDEWLKQSVHCPLCKRSAMLLLMRPEQIVSGSSDGDVRNHQRFLQLIRLAEDSDVEQLVRLSAHPEGRLNPYFAPHAILVSAATAAGGVDAAATATTTGYHAVTIDSDDMTAPNGSNEYVSLRATVRSMHRYRRYMLEAALAASDNESRSSSSSV